MDTSRHNLSTLFEQLGLPSDSDGIRAFVHDHRPLAAETPLYAAPFWNESQAAFLRQAIDQDADWAEEADHLDALLRHTDAEAAAEDNR